MQRRESDKFVMDLDRERIKEVLVESYRISQNFLETKFLISEEDFISKINIFLDSNRVSIPVQLDLPSNKYPGFKIEINLRSKKVIARLYPKKDQIQLNYLLKAL